MTYMSSHARFAALLAAFGQSLEDGRLTRERRYLENAGWICLGAEAITGAVHWTNMERGLSEGGPVTFQRAIWLQRTKDAIAARP